MVNWHSAPNQLALDMANLPRCKATRGIPVRHGVHTALRESWMECHEAARLRSPYDKKRGCGEPTIIGLVGDIPVQIGVHVKCSLRQTEIQFEGALKDLIAVEGNSACA